jgi:Putative adhesin
MRRGIVVLAVATLCALSTPLAHAITIPPSQEAKSSAHSNAIVRKVIVDSDSGDVTIKPGVGTTVSHTDHWVYQRGSVKTSISNGVLTVTSRCPQLVLNNCWTEITAAVARDATIDATTSNGTVGVTGMRPPSVSARTDNGDVVLSDVQTRLVKARASNGDVQVKLTSAPDDAQLRTNNGNVSAVVPTGRYALDLRIGNGNIAVTGVKDAPNSRHKLSARTANGDITVTGR